MAIEPKRFSTPAIVTLILLVNRIFLQLFQGNENYQAASIILQDKLSAFTQKSSWGIQGTTVKFQDTSIATGLDKCKTLP